MFENPFLLGMGAQAFNPSTAEAEAGIRLWVQGLCNEFPDSQGYVERPCLKRGKKEKEKNCLAFVNPLHKWQMWALVPVCGGEGRKVSRVLQ